VILTKVNEIESRDHGKIKRRSQDEEDGFTNAPIREKSRLE